MDVMASEGEELGTRQRAQEGQTQACTRLSRIQMGQSSALRRGERPLFPSESAVNWLWRLCCTVPVVCHASPSRRSREIQI